MSRRITRRRLDFDETKEEPLELEETKEEENFSPRSSSSGPRRRLAFDDVEDDSLEDEPLVPRRRLAFDDEEDDYLEPRRRLAFDDAEDEISAFGDEEEQYEYPALREEDEIFIPTGEEEVVDEEALKEQQRLRHESLARSIALSRTAPVEAETPAETATTGPTCFDAYMLSDEDIQQYLSESPNNFVLRTVLPGGGSKYECQSLDTLKTMNQIEGPIPDDDERVDSPYKIFYECNASGSGNIAGRKFVKLGSELNMVIKPDWFWDGPIPEPRIFTLQRETEDVFRFIVSTIFPTRLPAYFYTGAVSADHCNQVSPVAVFRLVPYTGSLTGGKRKNKASKRTRKNKSKKVKRRHTKKKQITLKKNKYMRRKKNKKTRKHKK